MSSQIKLVILALYVFSHTAAAQEASLGGRVVNKYQNPLSGCIVTLKNLGLCDTTNQSGEFSLTNIVNAIYGTESKFQSLPPRLKGGRVSFSIIKSQNANLQVFDTRGRLIHEWNSDFLRPGRHSVSLNRILPDGMSHGLYLCKFVVGKADLTFKLPSFISRAYAEKENLVTENMDENAYLSKKADVVDTLEFLLENYKAKKLPIESYEIELGNITLEIDEGNKSPAKAAPVYPTNGQQDVNQSFTIKWECSDPDGDILHYTVYVDTVSPPTKILCESAASDTFELLDLKDGKTYYWRVVASDGQDSTSGEIYSFKTKAVEIENIVDDLRQTCYIIGLKIGDKIIGIGSGFAVSGNEIMTNGHVVKEMVNIAQSFDLDGMPFIAVRDGGTVGGQRSYELDDYVIHPYYDESSVYTYDFAIVTIKNGTLTDTCTFAPMGELQSLSAGDEIATIGFPGETNDVGTIQPIATFKSGTISALRPFNPESTPSSIQNNVIIQHNFNTTGGTSGSPVFNNKGNVIAIHNSGEYEFIKDGEGEWRRIPVGSLGYAIRIDQRIDPETVTFSSFDNIEPDTVFYTFINGTYSDLRINIADVHIDTIGWKDTLTLWDYRGEPANDIVTLTPIVKAGRDIYWIDTLQTGTDFECRYYVGDDYFLLGLTNSTNKTVTSCVVENAYEYDSSYLHLPIGAYTDVGYYKASSYTDFRLYFYSANQHIYWEDLDTRSSNGQAIWYDLEATLTLSKRVANKSYFKKDKRGKNRIVYKDDLNRVN